MKDFHTPTPQIENENMPTTSPTPSTSLPRIDNSSMLTDSKKQKARHLFHQLLSILLIAYGLKGLGQEIYNLFYVYPDIPASFAQSGYSVTSFFKVYNQLFFTTLAGFISASYGLAMLLKPGRIIRNFNYILTFFVFIFTYLANNNFQLPAWLF